MRKVGAFLLCCFIPPMLNAQSADVGENQSGVISQIFKSDERVVVDWKTGPPPKSGDQLTVTSADGKSCNGLVSEIAKNSILLTVKNCEILGELKSGLPVTVPKFKPAAMASPVPEKPKDKPAEADKAPPTPQHVSDRVGISVFASSADLMFSNATVSVGSASTTGTVKYTTADSMALLLDFGTYEKSAWDYNAGLTLETSRELKTVEITGVDQVVHNYVTVPGMKLKVMTVFTNLHYRWDNFYFPFGLSLSSVTMENPPLALQEISGGLGLQFGAGWFMGEDFSLFFEFRSVGVSVKPFTFGPLTADLGPGYLSGANFGIKAFF